MRDHVWSNRPAKDGNITTNALPEQVEQVFGGFDLIEPGLKHKTVTVIINHKPLEITAYRTDGDYSDRRHPDPVSFTGNLKDDLKRRNFTMNGLIMLAGIGSRLVWFHDIPLRLIGSPLSDF